MEFPKASTTTNYWIRTRTSHSFFIKTKICLWLIIGSWTKNIFLTIYGMLAFMISQNFYKSLNSGSLSKKVMILLTIHLIGGGTRVQSTHRLWWRIYRSMNWVIICSGEAGCLFGAEPLRKRMWMHVNWTVRNRRQWTSNQNEFSKEFVY